MADRVIAVAPIHLLAATALSGCGSGRRGHRRTGSESRVRILGCLSLGRWEKLLFGNLPWSDDDRVRRAITSIILDRVAADRDARPAGLRQLREESGLRVTSLVTVTRRSLCGCGKEAFERRRRKYGF